jgi:UDPglucose--hexose-1-phosphate uridylyltransferase
MSQFRQNPISKNWVLIAPNRSKRPEQFGQIAASDPEALAIDTTCVFCPGNESKNGEIGRFPDNKNWQLRIIPNKFEALTHTPLASDKNFYVHRAGSGDHEVIITRKHNEPVALQSIKTVELTFHVFRQRLRELILHEDLAYAHIFHNYGRDAGASIVHPHYQIMSLPIVPPAVHEEITSAFHHYRQNGSCIFCDIIEEERKQSERIIHETEDFIVFAPYASRSPFEMWVVPKRHSANFEECTDQELNQLAYIMKVLLGQLYTRLNNPPLNFYIHTMPYPHLNNLMHEKNAYHWHLTIFPRLVIWAGFEFGTGIPVNPMPPEAAAEFLRTRK